jgi:hypothetical protein
MLNPVEKSKKNEIAKIRPWLHIYQAFLPSQVLTVWLALTVRVDKT